MKISSKVRIAGFTPNEAEVMRAMYQMRNKRGTPHAFGETELGWVRPLDIGSAYRTHHSGTLLNQVARGFIDAKAYASPTNHGQRSSRAQVYRISPTGAQAWESYQQHQATRFSPQP